MTSLADVDEAVPMVRPFVLAHLAEVERGQGKRRGSASGSRIVRDASPAVVTVVLVPNARGLWGFSPALGGRR